MLILYCVIGLIGSAILGNLIIHFIFPNKIIKKPIGFTFSCGTNSLTEFPQFCFFKQTGNIRPQIYNNGKLEKIKFSGFKIDIGIGTWKRPIPKFWKKDFWSRDKRIQSYYNPWNSGNHWFIITLPYMPYFFICFIPFSFKKYHPGFYLGGRTGEMNHWSHWLLDNSYYDENGDLPRPRPWVRDENGNVVLAWGSWEEEGNIYIEPSVSLRDDMLYS